MKRFGMPVIKLILSLALMILLGFIVSKAVDPQKALRGVVEFPKKILILLLLISLSISLIKTWRFFILLKDLNLDISFIQLFRAYVAGQAITPLPGGEAARGLFIKKEAGLSLQKTSGPIISQAYLELISATILMVIGSLFFKVVRIPSIIILSLLSLIMVILVNSNFSFFIFRLFPRNKTSTNIQKKFRFLQKTLQASFLNTNDPLYKNAIISAGLLSLLSHLLGGLLFMIISYQYGASFDIFKSIFLYSSGVVIQGLSISPGGIGLTEGGLIGLLLLLHTPLEIALPITIMLRVTTLFFYILTGFIFIGLFYCGLKRPRGILNGS